MLMLCIIVLNLFWEVCSKSLFLLLIVCILVCVLCKFEVCGELYVDNIIVVVIVGMICRIYFIIGWDLIIVVVFFCCFYDGCCY